MTRLKRFRKDKDEFFATHPQSPLTYEQQEEFKGLNYFPENPKLAFEVSVDEFPVKQEVSMQTSTGDAQIYSRYGRIEFTVEGQSAELTLYESDHDFFLPFTDALAGKETYAAGRYVEPQPAGKGKFFVDFNYAYNPYCAYNSRWSCPIPPSENRLKVPIQAGEKIFEAHPE